MKFRKKPVVIDAIQFTGSNFKEIKEFMMEAYYSYYAHRDSIPIHTLEGIMEANVGDWIIKGIKGEFYPCKPDIFEETYVLVEDENE